MELFVNYKNVHIENINKPSKSSKPSYSIEYNDTTTVYYKSHRIQKSDPITFEELKEDTCFSYYNMWNPYKGNILDIDPFGPLCFNPITIVSHIYYSRLNNLWIHESNENDGVYSGYYGVGVGAGENFEIINKGTYPERYIFRLPIIDCYLLKNNNMNTITFGPKLTDRDIYKIDCLMTEHYNNDEIYQKIGSLAKLKRYYDIAISKEPFKLDLIDLDIDIHMISEQDSPNDYLNRYAVDIIRNM